jgi:inorganic pyrophosphatase
MDNASLIGRSVRVQVDRPLGSHHPKHGYIYPVNYGFVPGTMSGDGEELDAYVLGISQSVEQFEGNCVAVIKRNNENDDRLVVIPSGTLLAKEDIRAMVSFQEQHFDSDILLFSRTESTTQAPPPTPPAARPATTQAARSGSG